jgi:predicted transcriptional regulator
MPSQRQTLNQRLALNLSRLMSDQELSASSLGKLARIAPNTVGNYLKAASGEADTTPSRGRERSAKLTEIERIATALRVDAIALLRTQEEQDEANAVILESSDLLLLTAANRLDEVDRALLLSLAQRLAAQARTRIKG